MAESSDPAPTVIVARRVRSGCEDEFRAWHQRIRAAASAHPGYVNSELQPPDSAHPNEWVTVYSFSDADRLNEWLSSEERSRIAAEAGDLLDGPAREQRVATLRTAPEPVTVVFSQRVAADGGAAFGVLYAEVERKLEAFPGFLGSELLLPVAGIQDDHVIVASFASRSDLDRWLGSDQRSAWLEDAAGLIEGDRTINVVGGFGGWFPAAGRGRQGPKRWKQAAAVLLALFPVSLLITAIRSEVAPDMHMVLAVFIANVLGVAALSFVLMPLVTKWLAGWLSR